LLQGEFFSSGARNTLPSGTHRNKKTSTQQKSTAKKKEKDQMCRAWSRGEKALNSKKKKE